MGRPENAPRSSHRAPPCDAGGRGGRVVASASHEVTDTPEPEPRYERFAVAYPSGTVIESFYAGGVTLREVRVTPPMAVVEVVEA